MQALRNGTFAWAVALTWQELGRQGNWRCRVIRYASNSRRRVNTRGRSPCSPRPRSSEMLFFTTPHNWSSRQSKRVVSVVAGTVRGAWFLADRRRLCMPAAWRVATELKKNWNKRLYSASSKGLVARPLYSSSLTSRDVAISGACGA